MPAKIIIGVMGPGEGATSQDLQYALQLGRLIAEEGWVTLSGGRDAGVMEAVSRGAKEKGGLTVGILPDDHTQAASPYIDIPIVTGMGSARNNINILTAHMVIICGMSPGTASEAALALKADQPVVMIDPAPATLQFFELLDNQQQIRWAYSAKEAIKQVKEALDMN